MESEELYTFLVLKNRKALVEDDIYAKMLKLMTLTLENSTNYLTRFITPSAFLRISYHVLSSLYQRNAMLKHVKNVDLSAS
jgi:hypothetical protein